MKMLGIFLRVFQTAQFAAGGLDQPSRSNQANIVTGDADGGQNDAIDFGGGNDIGCFSNDD